MVTAVGHNADDWVQGEQLNQLQLSRPALLYSICLHLRMCRARQDVSQALPNATARDSDLSKPSSASSMIADTTAVASTSTLDNRKPMPDISRSQASHCYKNPTGLKNIPHDQKEVAIAGQPM